MIGFIVISLSLCKISDGFVFRPMAVAARLSSHTSNRIFTSELQNLELNNKRRFNFLLLAKKKVTEDTGDEEPEKPKKVRKTTAKAKKEDKEEDISSTKSKPKKVKTTKIVSKDETKPKTTKKSTKPTMSETKPNKNEKSKKSKIDDEDFGDFNLDDFLENDKFPYSSNNDNDDNDLDIPNLDEDIAKLEADFDNYAFKPKETKGKTIKSKSASSSDSDILADFDLDSFMNLADEEDLTDTSILEGLDFDEDFNPETEDDVTASTSSTDLKKKRGRKRGNSVLDGQASPDDLIEPDGDDLLTSSAEEEEEEMEENPLLDLDGDEEASDINLSPSDAWRKKPKRDLEEDEGDFLVDVLQRGDDDDDDDDFDEDDDDLFDDIEAIDKNEILKTVKGVNDKKEEKPQKKEVMMIEDDDDDELPPTEITKAGAAKKGTISKKSENGKNKLVIDGVEIPKEEYELGIDPPPLEEFRRLMESLGPDSMFEDDMEMDLSGTGVSSPFYDSDAAKVEAAVAKRKLEAKMNPNEPSELDLIERSEETKAWVPMIYEGGKPKKRAVLSDDAERFLTSHDDPAEWRLQIVSVVTSSDKNSTALEYVDKVYDYIRNGTNNDQRIRYETMCLVREDGKPFEEIDDMIQMWIESYNTYHLIDGFAMKEAWGAIMPHLILSPHNLKAMLDKVIWALDEDESNSAILSPRFRRLRFRGGAQEMTTAFNTEFLDTEFSVVSVR